MSIDEHFFKQNHFIDTITPYSTLNQPFFSPSGVWVFDPHNSFMKKRLFQIMRMEDFWDEQEKNEDKNEDEDHNEETDENRTENHTEEEKAPEHGGKLLSAPFTQEEQRRFQERVGMLYST